MEFVFIFIAFLLIALICIGLKKTGMKSFLGSDIMLIAGAALLVRLIASFISDGFPTDIDCWRQWSERIFTSGFSSAYTPDYFIDYPPVYLYVLGFLAQIRHFLNISLESGAFVFLLKLPAIICDALTAVFIYELCKKHFGNKNENSAIFLGMVVALNPATILNSAVWGQVDSVLCLLLLVSLYYLTEKKILPSVLFFMLAILTKPQALIISPVYIFSFFVYLKDNNFSLKSFITLLKYGLSCLVLGVLIIFPFTIFETGVNFIPVLEQYMNTLASYPWVTVNAYNLYAFFGLNWVPVETEFLFINFSTLGTIMLVLITAVSFFMLYKKYSKGTVYLTAGFLYFATFMFSAKMHERYSFPVLILLIPAIFYLREKKLLAVYAGFCVAFFINCVHILVVYVRGIPIDQGILTFGSALYIIVFVLFVFLLIFYIFPKKEENEIRDEQPFIPNRESGFFVALKTHFRYGEKPLELITENERRMTKKDWLVLLVIIVVYASISFINLGNTESPETSFVLNNQAVVVDFGDIREVSKIEFFPGPRHEKIFELSFSNDGINYFGEISIQAEDVFDWQFIDINQPARYIMLSSKLDNAFYMEIAFRDENAEIIEVATVSGGAEALFDEQNIVPEINSYMNSTYFDEIYHARTAYEFNQGLTIYEWTHPPLGKMIISLGIKMFGMTPFGWRFMGNIFGILMIPAVYLFAKRLMKKSFFAMLATLLFTFDFMHFAQTRISTIDTYITFFVILMYYFMYKYYDGQQDRFWKNILNLFLSGLCMGLGIACKWPGMYAAIGLAVLFFIAFIKRHLSYLNSGKENSRRYWFEFSATIILCVLFFVVVPAGIYLLSYVPYYLNNMLYEANLSGIKNLAETPARFFISEAGFGRFLAGVIAEQVRIFKYHADLVSTHPFSSYWWQWPILYRPIYYFAGEQTNGLRMGISSFGNPAVWWAGIPAFFFSVYQFIKKRDKLLLFLIIGYLSQYLPWALISRTTYIYHYFPSVFFVVMMITYSCRYLDSVKNRKFIIAYAVLVLVLFAMFYPVISGLPIHVSFVNIFLKWKLMSGWVLI